MEQLEKQLLNPLRKEKGRKLVSDVAGVDGLTIEQYKNHKRGLKAGRDQHLYKNIWPCLGWLFFVVAVLIVLAMAALGVDWFMLNYRSAEAIAGAFASIFQTAMVGGTSLYIQTLVGSNKD